jgi:hypothetical protein
MCFHLTLGAHDDDTPRLSCTKSANALRRAWLEN